MANKICVLDLNKNKVVDFKEIENEFYNVIKVGDNVFTITKCKRIDGHDDSLPYTATLCLNGKEYARCFNDGWGAPTDIYPLDGNIKRKDSINDDLKQYKWCYGSITKGINEKQMLLDWSIDLIVDTLAEYCIFYGK